MKNKAGFTFIELFIAVSIFAIVAIALYSTFFGGISVWKRSGEGSSIYQGIWYAFDDMGGDFKNAVYFTGEEESIFAFSGTNDEVVFISLEPAFSEEGAVLRELVKIKYSFDKEGGQLVRKRAGKSSGFDVEKADKEVLLEGLLEEVTFEYCYDTGDEDEPYLWKDGWVDEDKRVPRGIKVSFLLKTENGNEKALRFSKVIFVPTGVLGKEEL